MLYLAKEVHVLQDDDYSCSAAGEEEEIECHAEEEEKPYTCDTACRIDGHQLNNETETCFGENCGLFMYACIFCIIYICTLHSKKLKPIYIHNNITDTG